MERHHRLLILILALAVTVPMVIRSRRTAEQAATAAFSVSAPHGYVSVSGAVRHPGIYQINANILTIDAIKMAEPLRQASRTDPSDLGALPVRSGETLQVSIDGVGTVHVARGTMSAAQRLILGIPLDLNLVTIEELERVPGIGPTMAADIIRWRQKNGGKMAVGDLQQVSGIGEKKCLSLKKYFQHTEN
jgi:competence protein ComEA